MSITVRHKFCQSSRPSACKAARRTLVVGAALAFAAVLLFIYLK